MLTDKMLFSTTMLERVARALRHKGVYRFISHQGKDPKPEDIRKFYGDSRVPLVGQMNSYDQQKKYTKRPLCVVYYDVDFSFENRIGRLSVVLVHWILQGYNV